MTLYILSEVKLCLHHVLKSEGIDYYDNIIGGHIITNNLDTYKYYNQNMMKLLVNNLKVYLLTEL